MASTVFINNSTVIIADWLNDVNSATYLTNGTVLTADEIQTSFTNQTTLIGTKVSKTSNTGSVLIPVGTTLERDATPTVGAERFNSDTQGWEGWNGVDWVSIGGGQMLGKATTKAIFYNSQMIAENLTVVAGTSGLSAGPITIADGFSVTIESGANWSIV